MTGVMIVAIIGAMTIAAMVGRNGVMAMRVAARTGADAGERGVARSTRRIERFSGFYFLPVMADFIPDHVASSSFCAFCLSSSVSPRGHLQLSALCFVIPIIRLRLPAMARRSHPPVAVQQMPFGFGAPMQLESGSLQERIGADELLCG